MNPWNLLWVPEIVSGGKKTGQNMKKQLSGVNKYDAKLGVRAPKIIDSGRYMSNNTTGTPPIGKTAAVHYLDNNSEKSTVEDKNIAKYVVPAALLTAGTVRAYNTGNALQLVNDLGEAVYRIKPISSLRRSRNDVIRTVPYFVDEVKKNPYAIPKNRDNSFKASAKWFGGMAAANVAIDKLIGRDYTNNRWQDEHKKAKQQLNKDSKKNKHASFVDIDDFIEKTAREVPGARGWAQKVLTEGVVQPALTAVPIVAIPTGISLALNKDIKGDFEPVRNSLSSEKRKKIRLNENDPRSSNNYAVNSEIMQVAEETAAGIIKEAMSKFNFKPFRNSDGTKKMYRIKDWRDFFDELPISGLRAASLAIPTAYLVKHDPVVKYREAQAEKAKKKQERAIVNKAVNKAVDKAVDQAIEQIQTM